jgi:hypothetical protein
MKKILRMLTLLFVTSAASHATTYYVSTTGSDSNSGSQSSPWATIAHAVSTVSCGDTVLVQNGTYTQTLTENLSCTAAIPVTFKSQNLYGAVIKPTSGGEIISVNGSYVILQNFEIDGSLCSGCYEGIKFQAPGNGGEALNNKIHDIGTQNCTGGGLIISAQPGTIIDSNFIYSYGANNCNLYEAIYIGNGGGYTVTNNIVGNGCAACTNSTGNTVGIQLNDQDPTVDNGPSNNVVNNNTIFGVNGTGILVGDGTGTCSGNQFNNNLIVQANTRNNNGNAAIGAHFNNCAASNNNGANNLTYNTPGTNQITGGSLTGTIIGQNPLFVNYNATPSGEASPTGYQLQATTSPAVGAGISSGCPDHDFNGAQRTGNCTVGAYTYSSSSSAGSPPAPPVGLTATVN